jgi:hypothetical protein
VSQEEVGHERGDFVGLEETLGQKDFHDPPRNSRHVLLLEVKEGNT